MQGISNIIRACHARSAAVKQLRKQKNVAGHLLLLLLRDVSQVQALTSDIHKLELVELANIVNGRLVDGLCQVQHLRSR